LPAASQVRSEQMGLLRFDGQRYVLAADVLASHQARILC
jgi:hypothetical protein